MSKFHSLTIKEVKPETRDAVSLAFEVPKALKDTFHFKQGQYLTLKANIDGEEARRSYSIYTGVNDDELRVAVKKVPGGLFSTYINERLKAGQSIDVLPPEGRFYTELNPEHEDTT